MLAFNFPILLFLLVALLLAAGLLFEDVDIVCYWANFWRLIYKREDCSCDNKVEIKRIKEAMHKEFGGDDCFSWVGQIKYLQFEEQEVMFRYCNDVRAYLKEYIEFIGGDVRLARDYGEKELRLARLIVGFAVGLLRAAARLRRFFNANGRLGEEATYGQLLMELGEGELAQRR